MEPSRCLLFAKTIQSSALKVLFEALKELLVDTTLEFDRDGLRIVALDNTHIVMIHLRLDSSKFEEYVCTHPLSVGINMACFYKLIKSVSNSDTVTLFVDKEDDNKLGLLVHNDERKTHTEFKITMMDLEPSNIKVPTLVFSSCVILPSTDFQKIIRDMSSISDKVEFKNTHNRLYLTCKGDFCSQETVLEESDKFTSNMKSETEIIQGVFSLKYLVLFCKCSSLCASIEVNLKNNFPLVVKYSVASLGELKLCLSPMCDDI